ncbi:hypothetical protein [Shewanella baltica]|uniref:hypothetical protein n=1 Tax=Shewanella baltica TaxID=62322 RepID=UPI0024BB711F|nr:hypothetical protein [Shewanella baltica]
MSKDDIFKKPLDLPMEMVSYREYSILAEAMGLLPYGRCLIMSDGTKVGWRSNRRCYANIDALIVAKRRLGIIKKKPSRP